MKNILLIESVQRKYTKRIVGMSGLNYYSRLRMLGLENLELRRLRTDVLLVYRILFGRVRLNSNEFFTLKINYNCAVTNASYRSSDIVIIEKTTCLVMKSLTYGIACRLVQQILLLSTSLISHLVTIII